MSSVRVGLALGGGAARGLSHLGVIRALRRADIPIDAVAGTSMGALVGALFCARGDIDEVFANAVRFMASEDFEKARIHRLRRGVSESDLGVRAAMSRYLTRGRVLASTVARPSVLSADDLYELLDFFIDDQEIRTFQVPFRAVAVDINSGEEVVFSSGAAIDVVAASSAVPGAFPPIKVQNRECIDGGATNMVPVSVARDMDVDYVIASNVSHELPIPKDTMRALEVYFHTHRITKLALLKHLLKDADMVVTPKVGHIHWADFSRREEIIEAGAAAAQPAIEQIREDLKRIARLPKFLRRRREIVRAN